jgi:integrase
MREPYNLYRRASGARGGKVFYVKFWDAQAKAYVNHRSIGSLVDEVRAALPAGTSPITRAGARRIVDAWLEDHSPAPVRGRALTLAAYLKSFWADEGAYAQALRKRGRSISKDYLYNSRTIVKNHVLPWLAEYYSTLSLKDVTAGHLEALIMHSAKKTGTRGTRDGHQESTGQPLSARTINAIRQAVAVPLGEAYRLGQIRDNPAPRAPKLAEKPAERGVLTLAEARAVLSAPWADERALVASMLAATTGMRMGEIRALTLDALRKGEIEIRASWADTEGTKAPKWNSRRTVPVPAHVEQRLRILAKANPWGNGFVFYGSRKDKPVGERELRAGLATAMVSSGVTTPGVTFHSWRHFFNSQMRDHIPDHALRQLTGHRSEAMTDRYTHVTSEAMAAAAALAGQILETAAKV